MPNFEKSAFKSPLKNWDSTASVRNGQRRLHDGNDATLLPFSPDLVPVISHSLVTSRDPDVAYNILGLRLFDYLRFTDYLETEAVVPASMLLARQELPLNLPMEMIFDGRKIATDEMYHAQCAEDLLIQMSNQVGIRYPKPETPTFLKKLATIQNELKFEDRALALLFFTIVSETLVTSILKELPLDERVIGVIREVVQDHNEDEAKHSLYYGKVLEVVWEQLSVRQRDLVGPLVPQFMKIFLEPDKDAILRCLTNAGFDRKEADQIWMETYPRAQIIQDIKMSAAPTIEKFRSVGALENAATVDSFGVHELL